MDGLLPCNGMIFTDGVALLGSVCDPSVREWVSRFGPFALIVADPQYGNIVKKKWDKIQQPDNDFADWMIKWTIDWAEVLHTGGAFYCWGGIGKPGFRPFYKYCGRIEDAAIDVPLLIANHITWSKKRAYGVQHNYLFTREELLYMIRSNDITKPHCFTIPLLEKERGYAGYNSKYPAKSKYLRRTNIWDVSEIFKGKLHECQKADRVCEIPIETHTKLGEIVIDLFAGSGSTSAAARKLGRKWIAIENDPEEFDKICNRMRE